MNDEIELTDDILVAYADGELDVETRSTVSELLKEDSDAAFKVAQFAETGERLRTSFNALADLPVPEHIENTILEMPSSSADEIAGTGSNVFPFSLRRWLPQNITQIAASLVIGILFGGALIAQYPDLVIWDRSGNIPIVKGPQVAHKIKPPIPMKMPIPNRDITIYDDAFSKKNIREKRERNLKLEAPRKAPASSKTVETLLPKTLLDRVMDETSSQSSAPSQWSPPVIASPPVISIPIKNAGLPLDVHFFEVHSSGTFLEIPFGSEIKNRTKLQIRVLAQKPGKLSVEYLEPGKKTEKLIDGKLAVPGKVLSIPGDTSNPLLIETKGRIINFLLAFEDSTGVKRKGYSFVIHEYQEGN